MKRILSIIPMFVISSAFAQGVWTGTTTPTTTTGSVGIGTTTPSARLGIKSALSLSGSGPSIVGIPFKIENTSGIGGSESNLMEVYDQGLTFPGPAPQRLIYWLSNKGSVGIANSLRIGTTAANGAYANYKLSVDGDMIAKRCVIQVTNWADYVFDASYDLPSLGEVKSFIKSNKHLPGVPNAEAVAKDGVEIGEMNKVLLQKVEELTLYMIQLKEENEQIKAKLSEAGL